MINLVDFEFPLAILRITPVKIPVRDISAVQPNRTKPHFVKKIIFNLSLSHFWLTKSHMSNPRKTFNTNQLNVNPTHRVPTPCFPRLCDILLSTMCMFLFYFKPERLSCKSENKIENIQKKNREDYLRMRTLIFTVMFVVAHCGSEFFESEFQASKIV